MMYGVGSVFLPRLRKRSQAAHKRPRLPGRSICIWPIYRVLRPWLGGGWIAFTSPPPQNNSHMIKLEDGERPLIWCPDPSRYKRIGSDLAQYESMCIFLTRMKLCFFYECHY